MKLYQVAFIQFWVGKFSVPLAFGMFYLDSGSSAGLLFVLFPFPSPPFLRPLTEEEIVDLQERHYDSIAEKQKDVDRKLQREVSAVLWLIEYT